MCVFLCDLRVHSVRGMLEFMWMLSIQMCPLVPCAKKPSITTYQTGERKRRRKELRKKRRQDEGEGEQGGEGGGGGKLRTGTSVRRRRRKRMKT